MYDEENEEDEEENEEENEEDEEENEEDDEEENEEDDEEDEKDEVEFVLPWDHPSFSLRHLESHHQLFYQNFFHLFGLFLCLYFHFFSFHNFRKNYS